jgi:glycosyltransferase involved in cell wall biosynthesis
MDRIGVMQITDTLALGGLERVAVNLANHLPRDFYRSHLCVTREEGPLKQFVDPRVQYLHLNRSGRFDLKAWWVMARYIQAHDIRVIHAHGTSLFIAAVACLFNRRATLVWHDHFGRAGSEERPAWLYAAAMRTVAGIISVNQDLARWAHANLPLPDDRIWYIPNFVCEPAVGTDLPPIPGAPGRRVICVANLRPQKDHLNLLEAVRIVAREIPDVHVVLLGRADDKVHLNCLKDAIVEFGLCSNVSWLGPRTDISHILKQCDIGVLSSTSEGLPLALMEYGMARLAVVATDVGQCREVLDSGRAGFVVPPKAPQSLARAIICLLNSQGCRAEISARFASHVRRNYSAESVMERVCRVYDVILSGC